MKLIEDIDYVFGLEVKRDRERKKLKLSQETYLRKVLERFGMTNCCPTTCLVIPNATMEAHERLAVDFLYSLVVGLVIYLAMGLDQTWR